jgi:ketosteroid isomerase-like protein
VSSRTSTTDRDQGTLAVVERFNAAFNRHDVDAVMRLMTPDCVFDTTAPAPDGRRFEGHEAVRGAWEALFASSPHATFETEEMFACGDRCVVRWRYTWDLVNPDLNHVRGVDIMRMRDGRVAEKFSYVKG